MSRNFTPFQKFLKPFQKFLKKVYFGSFWVEMLLHKISFRLISFGFNVVILAPIRFLMKLNDLDLRPYQDQPEK